MIEKIVNTKTIPAVEAEVVEIESFRCSSCGAEFADADQATQHHGQLHAAKATAKTAAGTFHYFATPEDLDAFLTARCESGMRRRANDVARNWYGPGWYRRRVWTERCSRNCCDDECCGPRSLVDDEAAQLSKIRDAIEVVRTLRRLKAQVPSNSDTSASSIEDDEE